MENEQLRGDSHNETRAELRQTFEDHAENLERLMELRYQGVEDDGEGNDPYEAAMDYALTVDRHVTYRVWLTMGGPNIFIDVRVHPSDGMVMSIMYESHWGGTSYVKHLDADDEGLGTWAAEQAQLMWDMGR